MNFESLRDINLEKEQILERRGVERDQEGKLILFHVTPIKEFAQIIRSHKISSPSNTGNRVWRLQDENDESKLGKTYLASKEVARSIATMLSGERGGTMMILEVHVDEGHLVADEDSRATDWLNSLDSMGTCAATVEMRNFGILERTKGYIPRNSELVTRFALASDDELDDVIKSIDIELGRIIEEEDFILEDVGK